MNSQHTTLLFLILTMLLWGATPLIEKTALREVNPIIGVFIRTSVITVIIFFLLLLTGKISELKEISLKGLVLFSVSGILAGFLGMWTYFYALKYGHTSKIVPITASYPLITAILSLVILKEDLNFQRIVGIILTIIGIILIRQS